MSAREYERKSKSLVLPALYEESSAKDEAYKYANGTLQTRPHQQHHPRHFFPLAMSMFSSPPLVSKRASKTRALPQAGGCDVLRNNLASTLSLLLSFSGYFTFFLLFVGIMGVYIRKLESPAMQRPFPLRFHIRFTREISTLSNYKTISRR